MKQILLAIDGSAYSLEAARAVSRMFHNDRILITVLTVIEPSYHDGDKTRPSWLIEQQRSEQLTARKAFERACDLFESNPAIVNHELVEGEFGATILSVAQEQESDLVVVGARGRSAVNRIVLGSTSEYVGTHAHRSVLIVRPSDGGHRDRALRVAISYDPSQTLTTALEEFADFRWREQPQVEVVTVSQYIEGFSRRRAPETESVQTTHQMVHQAVDQLRHAVPNVRPRFIDSEHTGEGLVKYLQRHQTDLIFVTETPRAPMGRVLLGSVSRYLLHHAPCSVWIARAAGV